MVTLEGRGLVRAGPARLVEARVVGIGVGMEVDVRTEIGLRLVVVSSFVH